MGLHQYEIIAKPCLINENMTRVSEIIYQKERVIDLGHTVDTVYLENVCFSFKICSNKHFLFNLANFWEAEALLYKPYVFGELHFMLIWVYFIKEIWEFF